MNSAQDHPALVYLAELTHSPERTNSHMMPLAIGNVAACLAERFGDRLECELFKYPDDLDRALQDRVPDIMMFSNYCWCEELTRAWADIVRGAGPETLIVYGGPNFPLDEGRQQGFFARHEALDVYLRGEGEPAAVELVGAWFQSGGARRPIREGSHGNAVIRRPDGSLDRGPDLPRMTHLDELPSPWQAGLMDKFFDGTLTPILQTNRGCPFSCTFCNSGVRSNSKIAHYSVGRVLGDLRAVAERVRTLAPTTTTLTLADDNFGMYERDIEIAREIRRMRDEEGFPTAMLATTGKNRKDLIFESVELLGELIPMTASVQSMNLGTLEAVKRRNIKLDVFLDIQKELIRKDLVSYSELILGLPGETRQSFFDGVRALMDANVQNIHMNQLVLAPGSILESDAERREHQIETSWRVVPSAVSFARGRPVLDVEEIATATSTMSRQDFLDCRDLQIWVIIFYAGRRFYYLQKLLHQNGLSHFDFILELQRRLPAAAPEVRAIFEGYRQEAKEELFDSPGAARDFYRDPENLDRLLSGEIGNALIKKYIVLAQMTHWNPVTRFARAGAESLLADRLDAATRAELDAVFGYVEGTAILNESLRRIRQEVVRVLPFDVAAWINDGFSRPLRSYGGEANGFRHTWRLDDATLRHFEKILGRFEDDDLTSQLKILFNTRKNHFFRKVESVEPLQRPPAEVRPA